MNRFRTKKKNTKDDLVAPPRNSGESESSSPFKMFGKSKKQQEETKEEIDLTAALPSSDDFRTSLLMTGLSARFSMLREQDDPNTKVGKASDDSVLFPKRQSRLMDFGFGGGLGDIAEVESIRAPFARDSSYQSDDASSINGSIMSRAKPTEGNVLFGGRQKIYKIAGNGSGATSGRALYDHDVAQSAFQKWRQSDKENGGIDYQQNDALEPEPTRPESPAQSEYNRRRETSSTTSSGPSAGARDSTAATSITSSQPSSSIKEWQNAAAAANPTPPLERSSTRNRRLYEQSLNQEMHNQQTSSLSRIDTLSKQRNFTNRTPELTPSPASATFGDRFANSRSILNKASAPNLRSFSPPTTVSSQASPLEPQNKFTGLEERVAFGATPPLSPPISEAGELQPRSFVAEKPKVASMSVLAKAAMYDESTYAQRQLKLQQGRDTPTNRFRAESNVSIPTSRSRSVSPSIHRAAFDKHDSNASLNIPIGLRPDGHSSTFFDDEDELENIPARPGIPPPPQVTVERPADNEHPALRKPSVPAPLTIQNNSDEDHDSPEDSPTLGPASGGLSGMVRAHLRHDSGASSVYGSAPNESDLASRFPPEREDDTYEPLTTKASTWESIEQGVAMSMDTDLPSPTRSRSSIDPREPLAAAPPSAHDSKIDLDEANEPDEFARHLADGARRVRERLTSYVESDSGSSVPSVPPLSELPPPPRANALGILKAKSSRGSLADKARGEQGQTKTKKLLGLGSTTQSPGPYTPRPESPQVDQEAKHEPLQQLQPQHYQPLQQQHEEDDDDGDGGPADSENVHAGLKAFRQARRELQRMKEMDVQQRYQGPQHAPPPPPSRERAPSLRGPDSRQESRERRPPPVSYNRVPSEDVRNSSGSRSGSRAASYRDRSGSENSNNGSRSSSRPPRIRSGSIRDEIQPSMGSPGPNGSSRQGGVVRSPSYPHQARNASPARFNPFGEQAPLGHEQAQPSAASPYGGPLGQRMMRPRDPSDPQIMPVAGPGPVGMRGPVPSSPLNAPTSAPPLPPFNPRRKTNTMTELATRRPDDEAAMPGQRIPVSPMSVDEAQGLAGFPASDDETLADCRHRLRKATSEANGMNSRARSLRNSPPHPRAQPPMPPGMARGGLPGGMI